MQEKEEKNGIIKMYEKESLKNINEFIKENSIDIKNGLNEKQIEENINKYGLNEIRQNKPKQWYNYFFESLLSPFNLILLGIAVVLIYTDVILPETKNYSNIIVILILTAVSTLLEFFEVFKSNKAAEKLKSLIETKALVLRNGREEKIALNQITVGDIIILSAGDIIPADLKIIEAKDLYVSQSTLTGESEASRKVVNLENSKIETITDLNNICFMGTNVTSGYAKAVVIKTGDNTYFGKIAHTVTNGKPQTAFQKGIKSVSKLLIKFMLVMIPISSSAV